MMAVPQSCMEWLPAVYPSFAVRAGVSGDETELAEIGVQLLGGDLQQRRLDALSELGFAGKDGDRTVSVDADPRIEKRRLLEAAGQRWRRWLWRWRLRRRVSCAKSSPLDEKLKISAPDPASTARRETMVGPLLIRHLRPALFASVFAARWTARRMRIWVPQRHRLGSSQARISASLAVGFFCSSACARIIMPGMQ